MDATRFEGGAERVNITLPRRLLERIDAYAKAHGQSRSSLLAAAARNVNGSHGRGD
jgi:metal-responsive CopG/Arc/MetJ family transcriptional regulator